MSTLIIRSVSILAISAAAVLAGCQAVPLTKDKSMVAVYQFGEFKMLLNTSAPHAAEVTQKVLKEQGLYQTELKQSTYEARFTARAVGDQKITIILQEENRNQTMLRIRWGQGGDLKKSRRLYESIEAGVGRP